MKLGPVGFPGGLSQNPLWDPPAAALPMYSLSGFVIQKAAAQRSVESRDEEARTPTAKLFNILFPVSMPSSRKNP